MTIQRPLLWTKDLLGLLLLVSLSLPAQAERVRVSVEGLSGELRENVLLLLDINTMADKKKLTQREILRAHQRAPRQVALALQPFGYYTPQLESNLTPPAEEGERWQADYRIDPGLPTVYRNVELEFSGATDALPEVRRLLQKHPFKQGRQLDHRAYAQLKTKILDQAYNAGYLDARFTKAEMKVSAEQRWADINWRFVAGKRYHFGDIVLEQDVLDERIVGKLVDIKRGEVFQPARLVDAQLALTDSDYFSSVDFNVQRNAAVDEHIPVLIKAQASPGRKYSTYLGYGTDTGARLGLGAEFRHLNKQGHQLKADARLSEIKSTLSTEYSIPVGDIKSDRLKFFASAERADVGDAETDQFKIGSRLEQNWLGMRRQFYISLARENFAFGDGPSESATILSPGLSLSWQKVDDLLFTRRGIALAFDVHGGDTNVLSDTTFLQSTLRANVVLPLGKRARLLMRGELGATWADDFSALPPSQRFFTGGDRSVRGYGYESISPENAAGDEIGGEFLSVASIEADVLLRGNYGMAFFYDIGSASNQLGQELKAGVGIGFRYKSPVGLIRIDFAHPLDDPDSDFRLHLTFGPDL